MEWPFSLTASTILTIVVGTILVVTLFTTGYGPLLLGIVLLAVVLYVAYIVFLNVHHWATTISTRRRGRP